MQHLIRPATSAADFAAFAGLIAEYLAWCRERYRDDPGFVDRVFGHQSLDAELRALPATYAAPNGVTRLAVGGGDVGGGIGGGVDGDIGSDIAGAGAVRWLADGSCEMKRVYVAARFTGRGLGRRLCEALIADARAHGSPLMRIDTARRFDEALALYESLGFRPCAPHRHYPPEILPHLVFMELPLAR